VGCWRSAGVSFCREKANVVFMMHFYYYYAVIIIIIARFRCENWNSADFGYSSSFGGTLTTE
jgi:hypothetical protein